jgi:membrane associated rhomboid family serine protease
MNDTSLIAMALIGANVLFSYQGFKDFAFFERYKFAVDPILVEREHVRLLSSGFLHVGWVHLLFNVVTLHSFSLSLEMALGLLPFLVVYFSSLLGGNLLALYIHRHHGDYSAVGASGAVCGMIFADIALFPGSQIGLLFLPFYLPGWLFGAVFVLVTMFAIRAKRDNIGHEAHLGGALIGMMAAILFQPAALSDNLMAILLILALTLPFLYLVVTRPDFLIAPSTGPGRRSKLRYLTFEDRYRTAKKEEQAELDGLLGKIRKKGIDSLSEKELKRLDELSRRS